MLVVRDTIRLREVVQSFLGSLRWVNVNVAFMGS